MPTIINREFRDVTIPIDGVRFEGCTFDNVRLQFLGKAYPSFDRHCEFDSATQFYFAEGADLTLHFIAAMWTMPMMQQLFAEARAKVVIPPANDDT